jgi:hypothetical protein
MLDSFITARNVSQKWKYEKRCIQTYTEDHLLNTLGYYQDLNHTASNCLLIGTRDTGANAYFATVCMKVSAEAIEYILMILSKRLYREDQYYTRGAPMNFDTGSFNTRDGLSLPNRTPES